MHSCSMATAMLVLCMHIYMVGLVTMAGIHVCTMHADQTRYKLMPYEGLPNRQMSDRGTVKVLMMMGGLNSEQRASE